MAGRAFQILVRSIERKFGLLVVIESPDSPSVGVVAFVATRSESLLVLIVRFVAGVAS